MGEEETSKEGNLTRFFVQSPAVLFFVISLLSLSSRPTRRTPTTPRSRNFWALPGFFLSAGFFFSAIYGGKKRKDPSALKSSSTNGCWEGLLRLITNGQSWSPGDRFLPLPSTPVRVLSSCRAEAAEEVSALPRSIYLREVDRPSILDVYVLLYMVLIAFHAHSLENW